MDRFSITPAIQPKTNDGQSPASLQAGARWGHAALLDRFVPELRGFRPLTLFRRRRTRMDHHALLRRGTVAVLPLRTAQLGSPSTDACAGDSSRASTRGRIPSVSVGGTRVRWESIRRQGHRSGLHPAPWTAF